MITLDQAKALRPRTILFHVHQSNADGTPQRWVVNGQPKTWKRSPERVRIPVKYGLYDFDYMTEEGLDLVFLDEEAAICAREAIRAASVAWGYFEEASDAAALSKNKDAKRAALRAAEAHKAAAAARNKAEAATTIEAARMAQAEAEAARDAAEDAANEVASYTAGGADA